MSKSTIATSAQLGTTLRKMVAVLQEERQALAGLDLEAIVGTGWDKESLCEDLEGTAPALVDPECRGLLEAARHMNEVNRQLRNLIAANVSARLDALTGGPQLYRLPGSRGAATVPPPYSYARRRG